MSGDRIYVIADFNVELLARHLANTALPGAEVKSAPFGRVIEPLLSGSPGPEWIAIVWSQPSSIASEFGRALAYEPADPERAIGQAREYGEAIAHFARGTRATFVPTFVLPPWHRGYGPLDVRPGVGIADLLARMNVALADALRRESNVFVLDAARWVAALGPRAWSDKLWYATKSPFTIDTFDQAAQDVGAAIAGLKGQARRLILLDLDDVLWGGSVGEVGWQGLNLGGHDHQGEAFVDFQRALKGLTRRGVQLAIVSKNDESTALEALERHPEMQLRRADFAGSRINWRDKAQNIVDLLAEIGLGPESAVFIDDSEHERARVAAAIPQIFVPKWPGDPAKYREALASLRCFDAPSVSAEDRGRSEMYAAEQHRKSSLTTAGNLDTWLESLGTTVTFEPLSGANLDRAAQLFNKTNQMNLSTRRLTPAELMAWASAANHAVIAFRVSDRFGDAGLTGLIGLSYDGTRAQLADFLLSCRVIGRNIEETLLHVATNHARVHGATELGAEFHATERNGPCLEFFRRSGWQTGNPHEFVWNLSNQYPRPRHITLRDVEDVAAAGKP